MMRRVRIDMMKKILMSIGAGGIAFALYFFLSGGNPTLTAQFERESATNTKQATDSGDMPSSELPSRKVIDGLSHVGQTFNNCSSVGLMIALSHWGIKDTQEAIAEATRPWNNPKGDNDDKSVTLYELADYAKAKYGLATYVRPNGTIELLKEFIANDIPVVARALMYPEDDIVHYRTVRGYDDARGIIIQSDGIGGPNVELSYKDWMHIWKDFNYSYLIVVPPEKQALVERILGDNANERAAWQNAKARAEEELSANPNNAIIHYNLVTANYYLGDYEGVVREFESIESNLTRRKLWYQSEPIEAYFKLGNDDRVMELTEGIINDNNKSVSEMYVMRGKIFEKRGDTAAARAEYEKAVQYHKHYQPAKDALTALGN